MPRYFFHVRDGHAMIDHEGTELAGPDEARQQAITAAGEILRDQDKTFWNGEDWNMHVKDEVGRTVCTLLFAGEGNAVAGIASANASVRLSLLPC